MLDVLYITLTALLGIFLLIQIMLTLRGFVNRYKISYILSGLCMMVGGLTVAKDGAGYLCGIHFLCSFFSFIYAEIQRASVEKVNKDIHEIFFGDDGEDGSK